MIIAIINAFDLIVAFHLLFYLQVFRMLTSAAISLQVKGKII